MWLRQSTASQARMIGPFVDDTDFKTTETALTIANTDVKISVNGAAGANKNSGGGTHRNNGDYSFTFDATDTATVGEFSVTIGMSGALPVKAKFWVLEEAIYDAMMAASAAAFDANQDVTVGGYASGQAPLQPTVTGRTLDVTATGEAGIDWANVGGPTTAQSLTNTTVATVTTVNGLAANVITAASIASNAFAAAKFAAGAFDAVWTVAARLLTAGTNIVLAKGTGVTGFNDLDAPGVRAAVGLASANLDTQLATIAGYLDTEVAAILAAVDTEVAAIKLKTDNLPASPAAVGSAMTLTSGERVSVADALLTRDMSAVVGEAARSPLNALRFLRNLWQIGGGVLTVMKEDDATPAWTANVTQTAGDPVSKIDPS